MVRRLVALVWILGLFVLILSLGPRPASALSCVHPKDQLPGLALLVQARVERVEAGVRSPFAGSDPVNVTLSVSRYFIGEGPAELRIVFDGYGWETINPVGSEIILGIHLDQERGIYTSGACSLRIGVRPRNAFEAEMLQLIGEQYGEGRAPDPSAPVPQPPVATPPSGRLGTWLIWTGMGALALLVVGISVVRRRRKG